MEVDQEVDEDDDFGNDVNSTHASNENQTQVHKTLTNIYANVYILRKEIEHMQQPVGSKRNPARTCRDLYYAHPDFDDGWYWIDPNLGAPDDAVRVFCRIPAGGESCVFADGDVDSARLSKWERTPNATWFSDLKSGFRVRYRTVGQVQLRFLRLLSTEAHQNFTLVCNNVNAWYSQKTKSYENALRFMGHNDEVMTWEKNSPDVPLDDCQVSVLMLS